MKDSTLSSSAKASLIRNHFDITSTATNTPLLQQIGNDFSALLVIYDCEDFECAIPHSLLTEENFQFHNICNIYRDNLSVCGVYNTKTVKVFLSSNDSPPNKDAVDSIESKDLVLSKSEKQDVGELSNRLSIELKDILPLCTWTSQFINKKIFA